MQLAEVDRAVLAAIDRPGRSTWFIGAALAAGVAIGAACFIYQAHVGLGVAGINHPVGWAVYIASFVYWVGIAHSGTLLSASLLLARARWRLPLARAAEMMTIAALAVAGLFPLIHLGRVGAFYYTLPIPNSQGLWPNFSSPLAWDVLAILTYLVVSALFLYTSLVPDLAVVRDIVAETGRRPLCQPIASLLSLGWRGTVRQYAVLGATHRVLAGLATTLVFLVSTIVSFDFAMSILPGWHGTHFGPYFVSGAIHSGLAMVLLVLIGIRRHLRLGALIGQEHLARVARLLGMTALVMAYFYVVEPFLAWISGDPYERAMVIYRARGPYAPLFYGMLVLNVLVPATLLMRRARRATGWLIAVGILVNLGMFLERVIIVVTATAHDFLPANWGHYVPRPIELAILAGAGCLFALSVILLTRLLPPVAIAELKGDLVLESEPSTAAAGERDPEMTAELLAETPGTTETAPLPETPAGAKTQPQLLGVFAAARQAAVAARSLLAARVGPVDVLAPCATIAHRAVAAERRGAERWIAAWALAGGIAGFAAGLAVPIATARAFDLVIGAKPSPPIPAYLVIAVLLLVLGASLGGFAGFLVHGLIRSRERGLFDPRLSHDRFGILVSCAPERAALAYELLTASGAEEIRGASG
jgi:molybdopterin-containing oxidoreductase family membrane subunit